jgi:hypothetical protein
MSLADLEADRADPRREFTRGVILKAFPSQDGAINAWANGYASFVDRIRTTIADVAGRGVTVVESAHLSDITRLLRQFRVVSVVAHGPFRTVQGPDIIDGAATQLRPWSASNSARR